MAAGLAEATKLFRGWSTCPLKGSQGLGLIQPGGNMACKGEQESNSRHAVPMGRLQKVEMSSSQ